MFLSSVVPWTSSEKVVSPLVISKSLINAKSFTSAHKVYVEE